VHFRELIEGVTGPVRSATAAVSQRLTNTVGGFMEHRFRRVATVGLAAAILTGSGGAAAWAISNAESPAEPEQTVAEQAPKTNEKATAAAPAPAEAVPVPTTEEPAPEPATEPAPEPVVEEKPAEPVEPAEPAGPVDINVDGLDDEQEANAVTIIETGKELGFDEQGWAVALATAMQEAKLYNAASEAVPESFEYTDSEVTYSDHDSVGLFQQRTSMGWGSIEELMDPATSASKFYNALEDVDGWQDMSIAEAAQSVQVSAYPDYYAQWEGLAWDIIDAYQSAS
jgi:hypothetical protein